MKKKVENSKNKERFANKVLEWYDRNRRVLPWRALPHEKSNPYHVWLSEIMLQQTGVGTVIPYFLDFTQKWPTIRELAAASEQDILTAWAGLGYYSRARNLHRCARVVVSDYNGVIPCSVDELIKLPGVGDYTANAIHAIAFDEPSNVVDGNVERVMARMTAYETPFPAGKKGIKATAKEFLPSSRHADYAQSLMDLGSMVCTPKNPKCDACPVQLLCMANQMEMAETYPKREPKKKIPNHTMTAFVLTRLSDGAVLMHYRDKNAMLGGMLEVPSTPWGVKQSCPVEQPFDYAPDNALQWLRCDDTVRHVFSHFALSVTIYKASCDGINAGDAKHEWIKPENFDRKPIPTLTKKILAIGLL